MTGSPAVSIVVPAFNAAAWIDDTLLSIVNQSFADWELIVADDASTDATPNIVATWAAKDARIRTVRLALNSGGPAGPRNAAVEQARAPWVAFCDADDLWHRRKLEVQLQVAQLHGADLVCSEIRDFEPPHLPAQDVTMAGLSAVTRIGMWRLLGKNVIANSSVLCRRQLLLDAGGFDADRGLVAVEDYDMWLRLLEAEARILKIHHPLVHYRRLPGSLSARKTKLAVRVLRVLRRHFQRRGSSWLFPVMAPLLMVSYVGQAVFMRVLRRRL